MTTSAPVVDPLQSPPPPAMQMGQQEYTAHSGHGSVGPVIGVLAVITILGAIAIMIGRLCSGRGIMGHAQYDFERWVETKCASCIDGRVDLPPPRVVVEHRVSTSSGDGARAASAAATEERREEGNESHQQHQQQQQQQQHE
ncbi:hypothetical protein SASPL_134145 [Salvia splendens]|uniref:Uncharacterized protein n=1 Tax=Salvia splendens TaxID=180675 RepID=A0A8X8ZJ16_SALSN|nr:uncharacterized protein LOC121757856 [Salvia splendens]KAG6406541.1 hypothetical protein SASPL_134145 [Salvia splendens]